MAEAVPGSLNQAMDMSPNYTDVMRIFEEAKNSHRLIDPEKLETSLAVKGAVATQQHALDAQILQHFYLHMRSLSQIHDSDIQKVNQCLADLSGQIRNISQPDMPQPKHDEDIVPPAADGHMDPAMVATMLELQKFAQQVNEAGGVENIANVSAAIHAAGGVQQFNAQLSQVTALSDACGGPQKLAAHLQVVAQIARSAGGVSQLADVLQQINELFLSCNGPAECGKMLQVARDVVSAAGGANQLVDLLKHVKALLDSVDGPVDLAQMLRRVAALCDACGGNEHLASMLSATSDLTAAFGGASKAQDIMSRLAALVEAFGGKDALVGIIASLSDLLDRLGGVDGLMELLARHKELLDRTADLERLHDELKQMPGNTVGPTRQDKELIKSMEKRVQQLEQEVNGFSDTIEQLRAAGRVEAMEDLMSNLMDNLVRA
eukprot:jgi/Ulvmu1/9006/UM005_0097.1